MTSVQRRHGTPTSESRLRGGRAPSDGALLNYPKPRRWPVGDKSPKSNERLKKQDAAEKSRKKAEAFTKAHPAPAVPGKKGK